MQKDYEFNLSYTDGGVLIYTGHLRVEMLPEMSAEAHSEELRFVPRDGEHLVVGGEVSERPFISAGTSDAFNTYVYFGSATPIRTPELTAVVDPGLPEWIRESTEEMLPRLFEVYAKRTAVPMDRPPLVFFSYKEGNANSYNYGGGTMPGPVAQLAVTGQGWQNEDRDPRGAFGALLKLLAHESAHLWNSQLVDNQGDPSAAWMHEGGADAFAFQVLHNLGLIDEKVLWEWRSDALNACRDGLKDVSLHDSASERKHGNYYTCGSTLALLTERAIQTQAPELDLFDFWRELMRRALDSETPYNEAMYFELLDEYAPQLDTSRTLRPFIYELHEDPAQSIIDLFKAVDVNISREESSSKLRFPD